MLIQAHPLRRNKYMKSWSLIISVVYFLTSVPGFCASGEKLDVPLQWAQVIQNMGRDYQAKADFEGVESAKTDFIQMIDQNIASLAESSDRQIQQLSQESALRLIELLQESPVGASENIVQILNNRSLSAHEKLVKIHKADFLTTFQGFKKELLAGIELKGFEKTFETIADTLRSRSNESWSWVEIGQVIVLIGIPVLAVVFVISMASGGLAVAAEVAFVGVWVVFFLLMATNS